MWEGNLSLLLFCRQIKTDAAKAAENNIARGLKYLYCFLEAHRLLYVGQFDMFFQDKGFQRHQVLQYECKSAEQCSAFT